ncbi:MAG: ATP synthase F1 subunit gamma [Bacteroidales bacterium]|jgi:F-type H+-transporting ATPase subunit gamma|nr:ATP synthase F1 subunit gamma [Bacteroidales bacterium]
MAGLKELKNRLSTVKQTEVMTSAMKMVSASKLRKAQGALYKAKAFAMSVNDVYSRAGGGFSDVGRGEELLAKKVLLVVLTSNKGLCGSFNTAVCKEAEQRYKRYSGAHTELLCIGAKGYEYFRARKYPLCKEHDARTEFLTYSKIAALSNSLSEWYNKGRFDKIEVIYSHPVNAMSTERRVVSLLPLQRADFSAGRKTVAQAAGAAAGVAAGVAAGSGSAGVAGTASTASIAGGKTAVQAVGAAGVAITAGSTSATGANIDNILFFPSRVEVAATIVPLMVASLLYFFMMESAVSEHGARMTAMSQATDNAQTLGRELNLTYNKLRQQAITNELLEIIAGANAL